LIDDILIYLRTKEEHEMHLGLILELIKKEKLYIKFSKCEFWLQEEVILNGDSPIPTRVIKGVVQSVAPTIVKQRLARKNELKARETKKVPKTLLKQQYEKFTCSSSESLDQIHDRLQKLISQLEILRESLSQEDINLKFLRSLPTEWKTYTLIWRNKTDLEEQSLDDLFNSLKIYEAEPVSAVASVSVASVNIPVSILPNVDTLSNAVIYSFFASQSNSLQLDNDDIKQIDDDDLEEMDLKWQMAMLTVRARKRHFARECRSPKDTRRNVSTKPQRRNVPVVTSTSNALVLQCDGVEDIKLLKLDVQLRNNALVVLRKKFEKAEQERDELKLKLEKFQTSSKNLSQLLASQANDKTRLGYDTHVFTSSMFDCDEMFSSETDISMHVSPKYDMYQSGDRYHAVPPPYTGTFMPLKHDLVFHDVPNLMRLPILHLMLSLVLLSLTKICHTPIGHQLLSLRIGSLTQKMILRLSFHKILLVLFKIPKQVKTPKSSIKPVKHPIPAANHKTDIPKPKSLGNSRNRKACFIYKSLTHMIKECDYYEKIMAQTPVWNHAQKGNHQHYARMTLPNPQRHVIPTAVLTKSKLVPLTVARPVTTTVSQPHGNPQHALKEKGVIDSGCSRHMTGNMSYLSDLKK
nr:hypothetical protein [Tanacetum cinerariifolium]